MIRAWQAATGKSVCTIALSDGEAASLAWSPDGKTFAVGQRPLDQPEAPARHLCLYDAATGKLLSDRHRDDWSVEQMAWSPDSKRLLVDDPHGVNWLFATSDNSVRQVAVPTDGGDGRHLAWTTEGIPFVAGTNQHSLCVWRAEPLELLQRFPPSVSDSTVAWHALSATGRFAAGSPQGSRVGYEDAQCACVYDCATGKLVTQRDGAKSGTASLPSEYRPRYAISRDGKRLARCGQILGGPTFFATNSDVPVRSRCQTTTLLWYLDNANFSAAWSHDGNSLAWRGEDGAVHFWNTLTRSNLATAVPPWGFPGLRPSPAADLHWSHDDKLLDVAFDSNSQIDRYSSLTAVLETTRNAGDSNHCWAAVLSTDGRRFAGAMPSADYRVGIFERHSAIPESTIDAITRFPITWSPDGSRLAARMTDGCEIWDVFRNRCVRRLEGNGPAIWSCDGSRFLFATTGKATVHDANAGVILSELDDSPAGDWRWPRFAWSPDGNYIVGLGRIWNTSWGELVTRLPHAARGGSTGAPAWSPDGAMLAYLGPGRAVVVAEVGWALPTTPTDPRRPLADATANGDATVGNAHPTPTPRVEAMLLTFNRGQVLSIAPSGHYRASPRADELLVYVVDTAGGEETLSEEQFAERFGWKNDVAWASAREDGPPGPPSQLRDGLGSPS